MRFAIISDIHANLEALEAVLAALDKQGIEQYLCLGDIVGYGADPAQCIARVKRLNPVIIAGNHDWASVELLDCSYFNPTAREAVLWTQGHLTAQDQDFLKGLQIVYQQEELTLVHGSLVEPEKFHYVLDISSAAEAFQLLRSKLCFIGHSHAPAIFIKENEKYSYSFQSRLKIKDLPSYIINAGSVGQPRDGNPQACYVVYDSRKKEVEIKSASYNVRKCQEKIIAAGLPKVLAERLAIGR